jgi:hypothetical protein
MREIIDKILMSAGRTLVTSQQWRFIECELSLLLQAVPQGYYENSFPKNGFLAGYNFALISPTSIGGGFRLVNQWEFNLPSDSRSYMN